MESKGDGLEASAISPAGRHVVVRAIRRGLLLRDLRDGSGQFLGLLLEIAVKIGAVGLSQLRRGWTVGVVSQDIEPWAGQRVLYRELMSTDPTQRVQELKRMVENGNLPIPQPLNWRFRRKAPNA